MEAKIYEVMEDEYPFGGRCPAELEEPQQVIKRVYYRSSLQKQRVLNKAKLLKSLSKNPHLVELREFRNGQDCVELIYEFVPFDFRRLLQKSSDFQLSQVRNLLTKLSQQLHNIGIATKFHQKNIGTDAHGRLKCYVAIQDFREDPLQTVEESDGSGKSREPASESESGEEQEQICQQEKCSQKRKVSIEQHVNEEQVTGRWQYSGGRCKQQQQLTQKTKQSNSKMDRLLQKINFRLVELQNNRRRTSPCRYNYDYAANTPNESMVDSATMKKIKVQSAKSSQIQPQKHSFLEAQHKSKLTFSKLSPSITSSRKQSTSTQGIGEYEALKKDRKQTIERIQSLITKADNLLSDHRNRKLSPASAASNF